MNRRLLVIAGAVVIGWACGDAQDGKTVNVPAAKRDQPQSATNPSLQQTGAATKPTQETKPPARSPTQKKASVITRARMMLGQTTTVDGVRIAFEWDDGETGAPFAQNHPVGRLRLDWSRTLETIVVAIKPPRGSWQSFTLPLVAGRLARNKEPLAGPRLRMLWFDNKGVYATRSGRRVPWKDGVRPLGGVGKYEMRIRGTLHLGRKTQPFHTPSLFVEVKAAGKRFRTVDELRDIGLAYVKTLGSPHRSAPRFEPIVTDAPSGNRVLRYDASGAGPSRMLVELVVSPAGKIRSAHSLTYSSCVVEGTQIDTPTGSRTVETIRVGDRVWSYDVATRARRLTTVLATFSGVAAELVHIGPRLRTTPTHPVYTAGKWVVAGQLGEETTVLTSALKTLRDVPVRQTNTRAVVYDLSVDGPHNFFADDVLVHNKFVPSRRSNGRNGAPWVRISKHPEAKKHPIPR